MSIDARISAVNVIKPSEVSILLEPREQGGVAGQKWLTIVNPPTTDLNILRGMIGTEIWGNASVIMVGDRKWADRIGYTGIKLVESGQ